MLLASSLLAEGHASPAAPRPFQRGKSVPEEHKWLSFPGCSGGGGEWGKVVLGEEGLLSPRLASLPVEQEVEQPVWVPKECRGFLGPRKYPKASRFMSRDSQAWGPVPPSYRGSWINC